MKNKTQNKIWFILLLILSIAVIASCGKGEENSDNSTGNTNPPAGDTTAPTVSSTNPADSATGFAVNSAITATFSESMDASTITTSTFTLSGGVTGTVTYSGTTATFTPSADLTASTVYTATITTGANDAAGNALATDYTWQFTTGSAPDTIAPTVISTNPLDGAYSVPTDATISVTFSEAMEPTSLNTSTFQVREWGGEGDIVPGTVAVNGATATFVPSAPLSSSAEPYQVWITTGATSLMGVALEANYVFRFRISSRPVVMWDFTIGGITWMDQFGRVRDNLSQIDCGVLSTDCTGTYQQGTTVQLTATALPKFEFLGWGGDKCRVFGTTPTISIVINDSSSCGVDFAPIAGETFRMTIGTGNWVGRVRDNLSRIDCGSQVSVQTCSALYDAGWQIDITAYPEPNAPAGNFVWRCTHPDPDNIGDIYYYTNPSFIWLTRDRTCFVELVPN